MKKIVIILLLITFVSFGLVGVVYGAPVTDLVDDIDDICERGPNDSGGSCTPCTFLKLFINGADIIIGLTGAFAIVMFVFGGVTMITAYGNPDLINRGKAMITATIVGILIVLLAWTFVNVLITSFGVKGGFFPWYNSEAPCAQDQDNSGVEGVDPEYDPSDDPDDGGGDASAGADCSGPNDCGPGFFCDPMGLCAPMP